MSQKMKFKELNLSNAFLFAAALEDPVTCHMILEMIMGFPIGPIQVHAEHTILYSSDFRTVRLDIYASEKTKMDYNLEMQKEAEGNLPKRSRYHQAEMDVTSLQPGQDFNDLKPNYVIFICTFDPFGKGLYRYTYQNRCDETGEPLGDETVKIFLNTKGTNVKEVSQELIHFLHYVENTNLTYVEQTKDTQISALHERIQRLKDSRRWEAQYMTLQEFLDREAKKMATEMATEMAAGMADEMAAEMAENRISEATQKKEADVLQLVNAMISDGNIQDISRLKEDSAFLQKMFEKYHIETNLFTF